VLLNASTSNPSLESCRSRKPRMVASGSASSNAVMQAKLSARARARQMSFRAKV